MAGDAAARYMLEGGFRGVEGWLSPGAVTATIFIDGWQRQKGVQGNVAEIGIHHGKFFLALKNLCVSAETAIAIDIFEDQSLNIDRSGRGDRGAFESNIRTHSDGSNITILQKNSLDLRPEDLTGGSGPNIRLFSIDGSHTMEHTLSDLELASKTLADGGVIVLDDFYSQDWPGVQEGFHHFMRATQGEFAAVALGDNKLFLCRKVDHAGLFSLFRTEMRPYYVHFKEVVVWGAPAISMALQAPKEIFSPDLTVAPNVYFLCSESDSERYRLKEGWSHLEEYGAWTIGDKAVIELDLRERPTRPGTRLQLEVVPFLHNGRSSRRIDIELNDSAVGSRDLTNRQPEIIAFSTDPDQWRDISKLTLRIDRPERPSELGLSTDNRPLGVKVRSIRID